MNEKLKNVKKMEKNWNIKGQDVLIKIKACALSPVCFFKIYFFTFSTLSLSLSLSLSLHDYLKTTVTARRGADGWFVGYHGKIYHISETGE